MEDYSDNTLRALIRQLIKEDKPNEMGKIESYKEYRALPSSLMIAIAKTLFSPAGAAGLIAAGLVFETKFTAGLLDFGLNEAESALKAVKAYNAQEGDVFDRLAAAKHTMEDETGKNKYLYLKSLKELKESGESFTAEKVYDILTSAQKYEYNKADPQSVSAEDAAIISGVLNGDIESVFDSSQFEIDDDGALLIIDPDASEPFEDQINIDHDSLAAKAEADGLWINKKIINTLKDSIEAGKKGEKSKGIKEMNNAAEIYKTGVKLEEMPEDELEKVTILGHLNDIEDNLENSFQRRIRKIGASAAKKRDELIKFVAKKVTEQ